MKLKREYHKVPLEIDREDSGFVVVPIPLDGSCHFCGVIPKESEETFFTGAATQCSFKLWVCKSCMEKQIKDEEAQGE